MSEGFLSRVGQEGKLDPEFLQWRAKVLTKAGHEGMSDKDYLQWRAKLLVTLDQAGLSLPSPNQDTLMLPKQARSAMFRPKPDSQL